jgi:hypothetical protein
MEDGFYHVFFSYGESDTEAADLVASELQRRDARVRPWLKHRQAIAGESKQKLTLDALTRSKACVVFLRDVLPDNFRDVQIQKALMRQIEWEPQYRVIPVLLPGAKPEVLGTYFQEATYLGVNEEVRFSTLDDEIAQYRLLAGILGVAPASLKGFEQALRDNRLRDNRLRERLEPIEFANGHALLVGISGYPHLSHLEGQTLNNARDMEELFRDPFRGGYPPEQVRLLLDKDATIANLRAEFVRLADRVKSDDTVIIFFSGHGLRFRHNRNYYLVPYDYKSEASGHKALISMEELEKNLAAIKARRLLVLLETCFAGVNTGAVMSLEPGTELESYFDDKQQGGLTRGGGRAIIAACRADEKSMVQPGKRNTLFTHFLLDALRGQGKKRQDGAVRVHDLFMHVSEMMPVTAKINGWSQTPVFKAHDMEDDFIVIRCPK